MIGGDPGGRPFGPALTGAFRAEVRDWLAAHVPAEPLPSLNTAEGFARHRAWERELAAARLSVVSWPAAYGGRDATLAEWLVFEEEYYAAGAPARVGQNGLSLLAPTLFAHGTADQRDRILPRMATADEVWAQAWSEPEAGSDLAAIRSKGVRVQGDGETGGGWRLSGTKTWCSRAAFADRAFGLFRTVPAPECAERPRGVPADRHRGLTYGALSRARDLACIALGAEQVGAARRALDLTVGYTMTRVQFGQVFGGFQALRHRMADLHVLVESARSLSRASAGAAEEAAGPGPALALRAAAVKVYCSDVLTRTAGEMIQLHGAIGITWEHPAHRYLKRAHGARHLFGSPARHAAAIAASLLDQQ